LLSEPRTISLLTDLIHIPSKHTMEHLREVYNAVSSSLDYENFIRTPDGARVEKTLTEGPESSTIHFRQDRVQVVEDNTTLTLDQYVQKLETVARTAMDVLGLHFFLVQQTTVRSIASPNAYRTGGEFIGKSLFRIGSEHLGPLGRPTNIFGFRLFFPATKELPHQFNVRIESYVKDARSIYIENIGMFKTPIQSQNLDGIGKNVHLTAEFVSNNICRFLSQFDVKEVEL
jgi:hypothetical protein